jgi:hypothetical protein
MSARPAESVTVSGTTVELSGTGTVFFDDPVITKGVPVGYYRDMAARMMPKPPAAGTVKQGEIPADPPRNCPGGSAGGPVRGRPASGSAPVTRARPCP